MTSDPKYQLTTYSEKDLISQVYPKDNQRVEQLRAYLHEKQETGMLWAFQHWYSVIKNEKVASVDTDERRHLAYFVYVTHHETQRNLLEAVLKEHDAEPIMGDAINKGTERFRGQYYIVMKD